jgi:superfamily II DNA or RNA helicase
MSLRDALAGVPLRQTVVAEPQPAAAPSLRDYQEDFVHQVRMEYRSGHKAVLLVAATGAGKTVVFSYIARSAAQKGSRVLILAHRDQLIKQASRKLTENGVQHGIIMAGFTPAPRRLVQVASVQTLVRRIEKLKAVGATFDLIVIDEAHLSAAASYMRVLAAWPDARVLGVTGSPIRLDGKGLGRQAGGCFDTLVQGISIRQLIDQGYLVRPRVFASKDVIDMSGIKKIGGDFDTHAVAELMDKPKITGDAIAAYRKHCPGVGAVAWCANVAHAQHVAAEFNASGIPAVALCGEDDSVARDKALADLTAGRIKVITFAMLLVEGVDCPSIGAVILLRPTMSLSSYLQVIGRGLRPIFAPGMPLDTAEQRFAAIDAGPKGRSCFVIDHAGLTFRHGMADEEREWSLDGAKKKKGKKKETDNVVPVAQCPKCFAVFEPADVCPNCGHVMEKKVRKGPEHVDGELTEVTAEMADAIRRQRRAEVYAAKTLDDLKSIGAAKGYSPGWAKHIYEARQRKAASRA